jgi:hypothetical protein
LLVFAVVAGMYDATAFQEKKYAPENRQEAIRRIFLCPAECSYRMVCVLRTPPSPIIG